MDRRKDVERTERYRQEASACATAAMATAIAEIKRAYLELEQGWLCLIPKPKNDHGDSPEAEPNYANAGACGTLTDKFVEQNARTANPKHNEMSNGGPN